MMRVAYKDNTISPTNVGTISPTNVGLDLARQSHPTPRRRTSSLVKALLVPPWLLRNDLYVSSRGYFPVPTTAHTRENSVILILFSQPPSHPF